MRKLITLLAFILSIFTFSQQIISEDSITNFIDKEIKVCSKVAGIFIPKGEKKIILFNMGKPYPNSTFTIAIFEKDLMNFSYQPEEFLKDKSICITGKPILYKGKPEIIATKEKQIQIVENELTKQ